MSKKPQSATVSRFSREWWIDSARIGFWVTIVTVLVWIYADMEHTRTADVTIKIRLNTAGAPDTVVTSKRSVTEVLFRIRGSRSDIERFRRKFSGDGNIVDFDLSTLTDFKTGLRKGIRADLALELATEVQSLGLKIVSSTPTIISDFKIEKLQSRQLPVEFVFKGAELAETPSATVDVLAPESFWANAGPKATIRTIEKDLSGLAAGKLQKVQFQLIPTLNTKTVKLTSDTVTVNLKVVRRTALASESIPITVRIVTPAEWTETGVWAQFKLVRRDP
ncbi:MAG: hypothetical protein GY794_02615, partial [bacterium]|nr:hypothetical protein [bacterium]